MAEEKGLIIDIDQIIRDKAGYKARYVPRFVVSALKRLLHQDEVNRHLTEEIRKMGTVNPQPNHNWKFVPEEWAKPALERDRKILFGK